MKILVTGGRGFVGRALLDRLAADGQDACGLSRSGEVGFLVGDLLDPASLSRVLADFAPDAIVNLAAQTDLKGEPAGGYAANVEGVANLIEAVRCAPSVTRVIWVSSQLVGTPGVAMRNDTDYAPAGPYGASKAAGEALVRAADGGGKTWTIARTTTVWGPGMSEHYLSILRLIRRGMYVHAGSKPIVKSYSYIDNLAAQLASLAIAEAPSVHARTFMLIDSEPVEMRRWIDGFARAFGSRVVSLPMPVARLLGLAGDLARKLGLPSPITTARLTNLLTEYRYDPAPIEAIHGKTAVGNDDGVARTAQWFLAEEAR